MPNVSPLLLKFLLGSAIVIALLLVAGKVPVQYNFRNLAIRWKTTAMTALAFTLVIGLMTVMLAFVNGMYRLTENSAQPGNVMVLSDGATDENFSNLSFGDSSDVEREPGVLRDESNQPLCSKETYLVVNQPIPVAPGAKSRRRFIQLRGIDDPEMAGKVHGLPLHSGGSWFSSAGVREAGDGQDGRPVIEAVLGEGLAGELGGDVGKLRLDVGDTFDLGGRKWVVAGIMQSAGSTFDSEVWGKRSLIGPMFGKQAYSSLVLRTKDAASAAQVAEHLRTTFKKAALNAQPETEYFSRLNETNKQFLYAIVFVTIVMGVGGTFGVMNTMFAAISQRRQDIGVLRIIGYRRRQILVSFLLESLLIALIGGAIGCAVGSLVDGWTAKSIVSGGMGGGAKFVVLKLVVNANTLAVTLLSSLAMGAIGGFLPALSAMRLRPLESLR